MNNKHDYVLNVCITKRKHVLATNDFDLEKKGQALMAKKAMGLLKKGINGI